jgi:FKBP-type peptidyl-prolyl cis-trans isomerase
MKNNMALWIVIVLVVVGIFAYITINKNNTNTMTEERTTKAGDVVSMNYTGTLADGTVFDSNTLPKFNHVEPFTFTLGAGQVIKGWDEGLLGMKVGEKRHLVLPPDKAYGASGYPPVIPPNATLTFDVELTAIK